MPTIEVSLCRRLNRLERRLSRPALRQQPSVSTLRQWARYYLPTYFPLPPSRFHLWLTDELDTLHRRRGTRYAIVAPRGAAKSTWTSFAYPLRAALENQERYIQIFAETANQAWSQLDDIRHELESNANLWDAYPRAMGNGPVWRQERLHLRNGVVIEAMGSGCKVRGRRNRAERPSLIIGDDLEGDDHVTSGLRRERSWRWFTRAVMNAGTTETNIVVLGTTLHRECLVLRLQKTAGWQARSFKAIEEWPKRMDLWAAWESLYNDIDDPDREAKALAYYQRRKAVMEA